MQTLRLRVDPDPPPSPDSRQAPNRDPDRDPDRDPNPALAQAAAILRRGGTVALPTETVYGLGANAFDPSAVAAIFAAKERPAWDPLIVHVCDPAMLAEVAAEIPATAHQLIEAFWPGPLTLLLPRSPRIPDAVTAGRPLVGVRMPAHPVALALIRRAGVPIAAPSANRFGHTSPTTAQHVLDDLDGRIDAVLDAGPTAYGVESTVLDPNPSPMVLYRPGAVTLEQIEQVAGPVQRFAEPEELAIVPRESMPSPGVGLRHYAPNARLILIDPGLDPNAILPRIRQALKQNKAQNNPIQIGILLPSQIGQPEAAEELSQGGAQVFSWGPWPAPGEEPEVLAQRLFAGLRALDAAGCAAILCPVPPGGGIAVAIRDRLRKAATDS